jgi:hypothetical protein
VVPTRGPSEASLMISFSPIDVQNLELVYVPIRDEQQEVLHDKDFAEACLVWSALRKAPVSSS